MTNYNSPLFLQKERKKKERASSVLLLKMNFMSARSGEQKEKEQGTKGQEKGTKGEGAGDK